MRSNPPERRQVLLAAMGDVNDPLTWSGIPYYFLQAGRAAGMIDAGLPLTREGAAFEARRLLWNATRPLVGSVPRGYQYSRGAVRRLWAPAEGRAENSVVINCFQLFSEAIAADRTVDRWFYLDMPLQQVWEFYGNIRLGKRLAEDALRRERDGYQSAAGLIANSRWAARSLMDFYGVPAGKIQIIVQSASFDAAEYARWEAGEAERREAANPESPPRILFVGRDWPRKGLDRLLRGLSIARARGGKTTLRVIGCEARDVPPDLGSTPGVEWLGLIGKRTETARFLRLMGECDVGCLLSRKEAGGVCLREFLAMGLATIAPDVGGAPEQTLPAGTVLVKPEAPDEEIAEEILSLEHDPARLAGMRQAAWNGRAQGLWQHSISEMLRFWPYPRANSETGSTLS